MKTDTCHVLMRKSVDPYTKYEEGGPRPAPSYVDSIRAPASKSRSPRGVRKINFRILPLPGTVLMHEGQRYIAVGSDLYERRDGKTVPIICWESHCADCGTPFQCWSGLKSGTLNRRCPDHHAPGKPVAASRRQRAARYGAQRKQRKKS